MAKVAPPDVPRFKALKGRVTDYYEFNADSIREQKTVTMTARVYADMWWLAAEARRLAAGQLAAVLGADHKRFQKVERYVETVCREQAASVGGGQFIKENACIFAAFRFLTRALEAVLRHVLEAEDQFDLGGRLPAEHKERVTLDIAEVMGADAEELVKAGDLDPAADELGGDGPAAKPAKKKAG